MEPQKVPHSNSDTEKSIAFLCTNNELSERETKKKSHLLLQQQQTEITRNKFI